MIPLARLESYWVLVNGIFILGSLFVLVVTTEDMFACSEDRWFIWCLFAFFASSLTQASVTGTLYISRFKYVRSDDVIRFWVCWLMVGLMALTSLFFAAHPHV